MARIDKKRALMETFGYDELDRLTDIWLNGAHTGLMTYDALGRMTGKMADGQQVFGNAQYGYTGPDGQLRPHAVSSAETGYNPFPTDQLDVDYTMFDKVLSIARTPNPYCFDYGYDHQRIRMHDGANYEKIYVGGCEFVSTSSGLASMASGGKFWQGFATGAVSSVVSSATDGICGLCKVPKGWTKAAVVAAGCLSGGVTATMAGGNFWEGVCSGLICAGLNHAMHLVVEGDIPYKRFLKDHATKYKHHWQTDITNPEGRCKAATAANIGHYFESKRGGENYYWGRFESLYNVDRNVTLEEYFTNCGFDFENAGNMELTELVDKLPEGKLIVFEMKNEGRFSGHTITLTGVLKENMDSDIMFRISDPMNMKETWTSYDNIFYQSIKNTYIINGLK